MIVVFLLKISFTLTSGTVVLCQLFLRFRCIYIAYFSFEPLLSSASYQISYIIISVFYVFRLVSILSFLFIYLGLYLFSSFFVSSFYFFYVILACILYVSVSIFPNIVLQYLSARCNLAHSLISAFVVVSVRGFSGCGVKVTVATMIGGV